MPVFADLFFFAFLASLFMNSVMLFMNSVMPLSKTRHQEKAPLLVQHPLLIRILFPCGCAPPMRRYALLETRSQR